MKEDSLKKIEMEMALLVRRIKSIKQQRLERSAYLLLNQLTVEKTAGVKALSSKLQLNISTVSRQAASLEEKGYIEKAPNPQDKRSYFYRLTPNGFNIWKEYTQFRMDKFSSLLEEWSEEECEQFGTLLTKFNKTVWEYYRSNDTSND